MQARAYTAADAERWDTFCAEALSATFLHSRRFLSYHGDRFTDRSLVFEDGARWLGVLPAAQGLLQPELVVSHPGITYGGVLHDGALRGEAMLNALQAARAHYAAAGYRSLLYKPVPHIYHCAPAQDDLYALFRLDAQRVRCDLSSCIDLAHPLPLSERRRRALKKAQRAGLSLESGAHLADQLWPVLEANLAQRHGQKPVHSLEQIRLLLQRFPQAIRITIARLEKQVIAGTVLFIAGGVCHTQYIASNALGHETGALDLVFDQQITEARDMKAQFFDFGISNEDGGRSLNVGLHRFKSEFGAGGVVHEAYEIDLKEQ
jgi:Acetyltransferase (GNAT) domain